MALLLGLSGHRALQAPVRTKGATRALRSSWFRQSLLRHFHPLAPCGFLPPSPILISDGWFPMAMNRFLIGKLSGMHRG